MAVLVVLRVPGITKVLVVLVVLPVLITLEVLVALTVLERGVCDVGFLLMMWSG